MGTRAPGPGKWTLRGSQECCLPRHQADGLEQGWRNHWGRSWPGASEHTY